MMITVTKRLVDIDDGLLKEAKRILKAKTMKEAVNGALQEVVNIELRRQYLDRLKTLEDLADPEVMRGAWRQ